MVAFYSALSGDTGLEHDRPQLTLNPVPCQSILDKLGLPRQGFHVFVPGAEFGPAKRWPVKHFAALAQKLERPVLLLGSGKEAALCQEIEALCNTGRAMQARNLAGKTTLLEAFELIACAKSMVSNDTGLMHVAAALVVPQVAIFGSSSPLHTPPLSDQAQVIWLKDDNKYQPPLDCAPCFERECPLGHTRCLNDIAPERVLASIHQD
jgi:heptosyltransferase-2